MLFDFDDTLVYTNRIFDQVKEKFHNLMRSWQIHDDQLLDVLNRFDISNVEACGGFAKDCFPNAMIQTYQHYCEKYRQNKSRHQKELVEELGWEALHRIPQVKEGAFELLDKLTLKYPMFLVTKGDEEIQKKRISETGLDIYFEQIKVVWEKNQSVYKNIIQEHQITPDISWSIGNSIKADINPALSSGLNCIHVKTPSWDFEHEEPLGEHYQVDYLNEIINILEK